MTKAVLFSGTHPRHLYVNREVLNFFDEVLVIVMKREELIPEPPQHLNFHDKALFQKHFQKRYEAENATYGQIVPEDCYNGCDIVYVTPNELNSEKVAKNVMDFNADFAFIFGVNLILDPVIDKLPQDKINLHLGLSPNFKGGATLYWPFYMLEPQFCGATFHQITKQADAGEIIHQLTPELAYGDNIHDVGVKVVCKAKSDLTRLLKYWLQHRSFSGKLQNSSGKNWIGIDFHPAQLRVIYDLFNDDIVDHYLDGKLSNRKPFNFSCIT